MSDYRLYCLGSDGNLGLPDWLTANSDEEAIAAARELRPDMRKAEIWRKNRLVASLGSEDDRQQL
jgi:hypothetical protein